MMKRYWFKSKSYGYGFHPISWEGWISTLVLVGLLSISAYVNGFFTAEVGIKSGLSFLFDVVIVSGVFTALFKDNVEGGLRWRWGREKKQREEGD